MLISRDVPLSQYTSFRIGGPADFAVFPASAEEILEALDFARARALPVLVMGNGSNLLVRDGGFRGVAVILGEAFSRVCVDGERVTAQAGALLSRVAQEARGASLTGLEFAGGIPGSVGGGVTMNAGAYGGQIADVLEECAILRDGVIARLDNAGMRYGYRDSAVLRDGGIVLEATFLLKRGDGDAIALRMRELAAKRREKQPLQYPSAGSVFKRPEGHFAGALIEAAGLKGYRIGGAEVSPMHAGFIVNRGGATARDVTRLIEHIQRTVFAQSGVSLECEVRVAGED